MIVEPISYQNPSVLLRQLPLENLAFLDSAMLHQTLGRYSYLAVDPFAMLTLPIGSKNADPLAPINDFLKRFSLPYQADLPPFQGGLIGYFAYDLAFLLEPSLATATKKSVPYHYYQLGCFDICISFDHYLKKAWIISSGFPEQSPHKRQTRATMRMQWLRQQLTNCVQAPVNNHCAIATPQCNMSDRRYLNAVTRIRDYIRAGDIFQANLARCYQTPLPTAVDRIALYQALRNSNPAPFASLLNFSPCCILSSSPERFLKLAHQHVETRPIKGTINRSSNTQTNQLLINTLLNSQKDHAENTMIVDLMRNDLSKVCLANSIETTQLCQLESYENLHHLVSVVKGTLKSPLSAVDLLAATFPGGSITGAPKYRAIEIIDELETSPRGPYCGAIAYLGFNQQMDSSIAIRTMLLNDQQLLFHSGGAITLDSDPEQELQETLIKAKPLQQAIKEHNHSTH